MDLYDRLTAAFGPAQATELRGEVVPELIPLGRRGGLTVWAGGLFHLCSHRDDLAGWARAVDAGARLFGHSAFGVLFFAAGRSVHLVDTQQATTWSVAATPSQFVSDLAERESRAKILREDLFAEWRAMNGDLRPDELLIPIPALPLGGSWDRREFSRISFDIYLSIMAQVLIDEHP